MDEEKAMIHHMMASTLLDTHSPCFEHNVKCKLAMLCTNEFYCQINERRPMDPDSWMELLYMGHQLCPTSGSL